MTPTSTANHAQPNCGLAPDRGLDRCIYCRHPILTAFVYLLAVRKTNYVLTAHARCAELAASNLPADQLAAAKAEHLAGLAGVEALFLGAPAQLTQ